jgi:hypothetical protein
MSQYTFANLSPYDFEILAHGLMEVELGLKLERFSQGSDSGIDLRGCLSNPRPLGLRADTTDLVIIQCKHYAAGAFSTLLRNLSKERPKVQTLEPDRYVVVTSVRLTPHRKEQIRQLFPKSLRSTADIYGEADLNALLEKFPEVERRNFKLWLTSTTVLQAVLHNDIFVRTKSLQADIEQKVRVYVQNRSFLDARVILRKHHVCIIAGVPGIGKTMLADMLLVAHVSDGFEAVAVSDDISEALEMYVPESKQVFHYDDFLGQTTSLDKLGKNEDARLLDFMKQISAAGNKRLILTTREYMLAQARARYERLARADLDVTKCVIDLEAYTRLDRAKILYNHIYFSGLGRAYHRALSDRQSYMKIIEHPNYNPRIVETVIRLAQTSKIPAKRFVAFFVQALDNPEAIWAHAFENQLAPDAQLVLMLLAGMPTDVPVSALRVAFASAYRLRNGTGPGPTQFTQVLRTLEDNFIAVEAFGDERLIRFHNPSIRDFLHGRLNDDPWEYLALLDGALYFDQVMLLASYAGVEISRRGGRLPERDFAGLSLALSGEPDRLIAAMERTFLSKECGVSLLWVGNFRLPREPMPLSPEERARAVLVAVKALGIDIPAWLSEHIQASQDRWIRGAANKSEVLALQEALHDATPYDNRPGQGEQLKTWFMSTLDSPDDFRALDGLQRLYPGLLDDDDLLEAADSVLPMIEEEFRDAVDSASSAGELERAYDGLVQIAEEFGLDAHTLFDMDRYEERLQELAQVEDWQEEEAKERWRDERLARRSEDSAIHALFSTLDY